MKKKENRNSVEPGPFVSQSLSLTTTRPRRPAKIPKNLGT